MTRFILLQMLVPHIPYDSFSSVLFFLHDIFELPLPLKKAHDLNSHDFTKVDFLLW